MTSLLFISHDVVGSAMAGPGIRAAELSRVLAAEHSVTLAAPQPADALPEGVRGFTYRWGDAASLAPALDAAELIVANGLVLVGHPEIADRAAPLVLDLYDPTPLENLVLLRERAPAERAEQSRRDAALLVRQLQAGDCFLCATERQRDLYLGALLAAGRVAPALADADPALRGLLRVVPFGLPAAPPAPAPPPWRAQAGEQAILWSGGLWDWMDPLTLIRALPEVLAAAPHARLVFLAGQHPGSIADMHMPARARALAAKLGLGEPQLTFVDGWVDYAERAGALLHAAVAIYLHEAGLESEYAAVRSRFLDHLWAGLPSVVSAGDAAAELVARHGLGRVVAPGDTASTAAALIALLRDADERRGCAERARALAAEYTWERTAAPLLEFCRDGRRTTGDGRPTADGQSAMYSGASVAVPLPSPEAMIPDTRDIHTGIQPMNDDQRNTALERLDSLWNVQPQPLTSGVPLLGQAKELANSLARWYLQSVVEQQNVFNAAVVQALSALSANDDRRHNELVAHIHLLHNQINGVRHELAALLRRIEQDERRVGKDEQQIEEHRQRIEALAQHLADADEADTTLAGKFLQLQQQLAARNGEHAE